jgi:hypothetical protein
MKNVMLCSGEPVLIDMDTLSTGNPVFDLGNLFVAYMAYNEDEPTNSAEFIGVGAEDCAALMEKTLSRYLGTPDAATLHRAMQKVRAVGYVRFLYLVAVMRMSGEALTEPRIRHTAEHLTALLDELDSFAL